MESTWLYKYHFNILSDTPSPSSHDQSHSDISQWNLYNPLEPELQSELKSTQWTLCLNNHDFVTEIKPQPIFNNEAHRLKSLTHFYILDFIMIQNKICLLISPLHHNSAHHSLSEMKNTNNSFILKDIKPHYVTHYQAIPSILKNKAKILIWITSVHPRLLIMDQIGYRDIDQCIEHVKLLFNYQDHIHKSDNNLLIIKCEYDPKLYAKHEETLKIQDSIYDKGYSKPPFLQFFSTCLNTSWKTWHLFIYQKSASNNLVKEQNIHLDKNEILCFDCFDILRRFELVKNLMYLPALFKQMTQSCFDHKQVVKSSNNHKNVNYIPCNLQSLDLQSLSFLMLPLDKNILTKRIIQGVNHLLPDGIKVVLAYQSFTNSTNWTFNSFIS